MRYQSKPYRSLSFLQREALQLNLNKENKENNNVNNLPQRQHKLKEPEPHKPTLHHPSIVLSQIEDTPSSPFDLKQSYTQLILKDYSSDILSHLISHEGKQNTILSRHGITSSLRSKMVDWMIEVLSSYKMSEETFFRSVYLMDGYLRNCPSRLEVKDLHLIGVTAMFAGAKYEQIHPLKLSVIYDKIARKKFKKTDILDKEASIVNALQFKLEVPSQYDIARHIVEFMKLPLSLESQKYFSKILLYLSKMVLFSHQLAEEDPALLACGIVFIGLKTLEQVDPSAQPESHLSQIGTLGRVEEESVLEVSRKVLQLAKNFSKFYPSLANLKKFNKFQYGSD